MLQNLTDGQKEALAAIVRHICEHRLKSGTHLPEWTVAKIIGTSRTPVRAVFDELVKEGVLQFEKNKGYSLSIDADEIPSSIIDYLQQPRDTLYAEVAEARISGQLPESMTESDLMRRFAAKRARVQKVLTRAQREGWVEKEAGYGIRFLPIIDTRDAYDDMYRLRLAIEPAGILSPKFHPSLRQLRELRDEQQAILEGGHSLLTPYDRFESNARFHETIMAWSQNQFALKTLRNLYQMRRLAEYRQEGQAKPRQKEVAQEHLILLDAIECGDTILAASLMRQHIASVVDEKVASLVL